MLPKIKEPLARATPIKQSENLLNRNSTEGAMNRLSTPLGNEARDAALGPAAPKLNAPLETNAPSTQPIGNSAAIPPRRGNSWTFWAVVALAFSAHMRLDRTLATGGLTGALLGAGRRYAPLLAGKLATKKKRLLAPEIAGLLTRRALPNAPVPKGVVPLLGQAIEKLSQAKKDALARGLAASGIAYGTNPGAP